MATELVSCPACGRKNASDRTTCFSCGADLPIFNTGEQKQVTPPWEGSLWQRLRTVRLNGWQRLWIFLNVLWFVVVAFFTYGDREPQYSVAFFFWAVPCVVLYAFGWAIGWVRRSFQEEDNLRRPTRVGLRLTPWWRGWLRLAIVGYFVSWPVTFVWLNPIDRYSTDQVLGQLSPYGLSVPKDAWCSVIAGPEFLQLSPDERKRLAAEHFDREIAPLLHGAYWKREPFRSQFVETSALTLEEVPIKQWYNPVEPSRPIPYRDIYFKVHIDVDSDRLYRDISVRALIYEVGVLLLIIPAAPAIRRVVSGFGGAGVIKRVGSHVSSLTLEQATKLAIISSLLLVAVSVFYYLIIYMPHKEEALLKLQKEEQVAKERKEAEERSAREIELGNCLLYARAHYEENWATACQNESRRRLGLDTGPNCALSIEAAQRQDALNKESKDECYKKYPQR